jgi:nitrite reductase/ring-hydroxylating ferredoxin subunit
MADINFNCPHCGQNLNGPEEMGGETIDCPVCQKSFQIPGGIIEVPKTKLAPPSRPAAPASPTRAIDDEKGKTVRIELPPEFLAEPEKHIFKIKRIQR